MALAERAGAAGFLHLAGAGEGEGVGGDVFGDDAARADDRAIANGDWGDQGDVRADEGIRADGGAVLGATIVIAGDGARTDIGARADAGVPKVREVIDLGFGAEMGGFDFAEIADMSAFADQAAGADAGERADDGAWFDGAAFEVRKGADGDIGCEAHAGAEHHVGFDGDIGGEDGVGGEKHSVRGGHGDTGGEGGGAQAGLQGRFGGGKLGAGIDAKTLLPWRFDHAHGLTIGAGAGHEVGEVIFGLGVVIINAAQPGAQGGGVAGEAADIAQGDRFFGLGGVSAFDDALGGAVLGDDAAKRAGIGRVGADQSEAGSVGAAHRIDQGLENRGGEQRIIAVNDGDEAFAELRFGGAGGVGGAEPFGLDQAGVRRGEGGDGGHVRPGDHHDPVIERGEAVDQVREHRQARDAVRHFRVARFHPGAKPGGEDDGGFVQRRHENAVALGCVPCQRMRRSRYLSEFFMADAVCGKRAAIFDLDGTLIDSLPDLAAALNRSLARHGEAPVEPALVKPMIGDGALMLLKRGYAVRGLVPSDADVQIFLEDYEAHVTDLTVVFAGIPQALATLADEGYVLAVCTNKPEVSARKVLAALDLEAPFQAVIGGDATPFRKPDPRHLQAVLDAIGVPASCAVMIGDHPNDLAAAAGCATTGIFCNWGYGRADAAFQVDEPAELAPMIGAILAT